MATLTGSIEADVPIAFADREWTEFVFRNLYGSYAKGFEDAATSINETDADSGTVTFETEGERLVKVSVELTYTPRGGGDRGAPRSPAPRRAWTATSRSTAPFCSSAVSRRSCRTS